jgi:hypothetical protein
VRVRLRLSFVILTATVLLLPGCGARRAPVAATPADNTADVCARWVASTKQFTSHGADAAPAAKAYQKAIADEYAGRGLPQKQALEIQRDYWSAQESTPRALAAEATSPRLRAALSAYADELTGRAADVVPEFAGSTSAALTTLNWLCAQSRGDRSR